MKIITTTIMGILALVSSGAFAAEYDRHFDVTTDAGRAVAVYTHTKYDEACHQSGIPRIEIISKPEHGKATGNQRRILITTKLIGPDCIGHTMSGLEVTYVPQKGFHGTDTFSYEVNYGNKSAQNSVTVNVK